MPATVQRFEATYTIEAIQKAEAVKKLEAIPPGLVTREAVEAAAALDPAVARSLQQRYEAQEARYNAGIYKETAESFKATANGVTSFGTNKPNTPSSVFLQERMKAEYRARVDRAVAGGMDFQQASTTIGQALDAEVKAGARDPNSPWYRKADAPGGAAQFPNLNKGSLPALEQANRRFADLKKNIRTNVLGKVIDTKGSIITAEEAPAIVGNYGKAGFSIPQTAGVGRDIAPQSGAGPHRCGDLRVACSRFFGERRHGAARLPRQVPCFHACRKQWHAPPRETCPGRFPESVGRPIIWGFPSRESSL